MDISAEKYTIKLTENELWTIGFCIKSDIENSIKNHWVNHQLNWENSEKEKLALVKQIFLSLGRPDIFDDILYFANETFNVFNKEKK